MPILRVKWVLNWVDLSDLDQWIRVILTDWSILVGCVCFWQVDPRDLDWLIDLCLFCVLLTSGFEWYWPIDRCCFDVFLSCWPILTDVQWFCQLLIALGFWALFSRCFVALSQGLHNRSPESPRSQESPRSPESLPSCRLYIIIYIYIYIYIYIIFCFGNPIWIVLWYIYIYICVYIYIHACAIMCNCVNPWICVPTCVFDSIHRSWHIRNKHTNKTQQNTIYIYIYIYTYVIHYILVVRIQLIMTSSERSYPTVFRIVH